MFCRMHSHALATMLFWTIAVPILYAQPTAAVVDLPPVAPVMECSQLAQVDLSGLKDAPARITSAVPVGEAQDAGYCRILGYVAPRVNFEVRLPLAGWTQRYLQTGCGGLCGNLNVRVSNADGCAPAQRGELAVASTDMGHSSSEAAWQEDAQRRIDFAYRGVHVTAVAAKALIEKFYGQKPRYSYFAGCSDGGREALMEAQRYPEDFNGIMAGAPAMNFITQNTFYHGWNARVNTGAGGSPILTAAKLPILHAAAVAACDEVDGLRDGLIGDPRACRFVLLTGVCSLVHSEGPAVGMHRRSQVTQTPKTLAGSKTAPGGENATCRIKGRRLSLY